MRKFQYLVTIDLDDRHLEGLIKEDPSLLEGEVFKGVTPETFVSFIATGIPGAIDISLKEGLGDTGESKVRTIFAGEVK